MALPRALSGWLRAAAAWIHPGPSGPAVAVAFHRLYAAVAVVAWLSLGAQVQLLIGRDGLLPLAPFLEMMRAQPDGLPLSGYPSLLRWPGLATDTVLVAGT